MAKCPSDVADRFAADIANHELTILKDDGLYRHLRFAKPGTRAMSFDILTWPGHLCYTGDMGTYVFSRVWDMLDFFRGERINPSYWAEKVLAEDKSDGVRQWSKELFKECLLESFAEWAEGVDKEVTEDAMSDLRTEVIDGLDDFSKDMAYKAVMEFQYQGKPLFQDWWEVDTDEYTFRYIWCLHALVWGIQRYDKATAKPSEEASSDNATRIRTLD